MTTKSLKYEGVLATNRLIKENEGFSDKNQLIKKSGIGL